MAFKYCVVWGSMLVSLIMDENEPEVKAESRLYELGVLIAPTVPEEKIPAEFGDLIALVEKAGGRLSASDMPRMIILAYPISQTREHKKTSFSQAYFGWLRFESPAASVERLHDELKRQDEVLRFLIISLPKITASVPRRRPIVPRRPPEAVVVAPMTREQIDKEIEQLLSETKV